MITKKIWQEPLLWAAGALGIVALATGLVLVQQVAGGDVQSPVPPLPISEDHQDFRYFLRADATPFQEELFDGLIAAREAFEAGSTPASESAYAQALVKNFIADFFTWSNKLGRSDVGGLQFIDSRVRSGVRSLAVDEFYLYLNQYIQTFGNQELLEVERVIIDSVELDALWELDIELPEPELDGFGNEIEPEEPVETYLEVIRVVAHWEYAPAGILAYGDFQREAVFYLQRGNGFLSIYAMLELPQEEGELDV